MQRFAEVVLQKRMGRPIVDRTGLAGEYDFQMGFAPVEVAAKEESGQAGPAPSAPEGLQEQLGLRLDAIKGPAGFLVIDQVERPTAN